jgi:hypothetical protein
MNRQNDAFTRSNIVVVGGTRQFCELHICSTGRSMQIKFFNTLLADILEDARCT